MNENTVFSKTDRGREEIRTRAAKLAGPPRALLIAVDGTKTVAALAREYPVAGGIENLLDHLLHQGFIESGTADHAGGDAATDFARYRAATQFLNESMSLLGLGGYLFSLKIQRCGNLAELRELGPEFRSALAKKRGEKAAETLMQRFRELIG